MFHVKNILRKRSCGVPRHSGSKRCSMSCRTSFLGRESNRRLRRKFVWTCWSCRVLLQRCLIVEDTECMSSRQRHTAMTIWQVRIFLPPVPWRWGTVDRHNIATIRRHTAPPIPRSRKFSQKFVEQKSISCIFRTSWHVREVECYAPLKSQPPTTLGDP